MYVNLTTSMRQQQLKCKCDPQNLVSQEKFSDVCCSDHPSFVFLELSQQAARLHVIHHGQRFTGFRDCWEGPAQLQRHTATLFGFLKCGLGKRISYNNYKNLVTRFQIRLRFFGTTNCQLQLKLKR